MRPRHERDLCQLETFVAQQDKRECYGECAFFSTFNMGIVVGHNAKWRIKNTDANQQMKAQCPAIKEQISQP